jgi:hypothetical protein
MSIAPHVDHPHPDAVRRRINRLLSADEKYRAAAPITLPGKSVPRLPALSPAPAPPPSPPLSQTGHHGSWAQYLGRESLRQAEEAQPSDAKQGAWTREQLLRMDAAFVRHVERAFRRGTESRAAASATVTPRRGRP